MKLLSDIKSSADVKKLETDQLEELCKELREEIIASVSKTGGHLASNLGAVELTVALHRVYDTSRDRVVFDVGHQCYAHKMLTGRLDKFDTLRSFGGISGFPKPCESDDDAAIAGHASTSISNALGMARARTILGEKYDVCAVIGDGALTGGLAYEGLSDCGASGEPIVVVLNDNCMSINANVGGMARMLSLMRVRQSYISFKKLYHRTLGKIRIFYKPIHWVKEHVKDLFLPDNMFEDMGFKYLGPIDGHDIKTVTRTIRYARDMACPTIVHICTVKGKGYAPAEEKPENYHGVGSFDPDKGVDGGKKADFSAAFGDELCRLAENDRRITAVTAAMCSGTGLDGFAKRYPDRFFDVGIAEEHAVSLCAGMAKQGLRPVFAVYSSFLQRGYDMMIHDVSLSNLPVTFCIDRGGLVGADGETHHGCFDVGYLSSVPGMAVFAPANFAELRSMLGEAVSLDSPSAVRYPRGCEGSFKDDLSVEREAIVRTGEKVTIVSYGIMINEAIEAAEKLDAEVIKLNRLDGGEFQLCLESVKKTGRIIVAEDCAEAGCVGTRILAYFEKCRVLPEKVRLMNLGSGIVPHGSVSELMHYCGIDAAAIEQAAKSMTEEVK